MSSSILTSVSTLLMILVMPWTAPGILLVRWARGNQDADEAPLGSLVGLALVAVTGTVARWIGAPAVLPILVLALVSAVALFWRGRPFPGGIGLGSWWILALFYALPLMGEFAPPGGDMTMHGLFARWIDESVLFPRSLGPLLPDVRFDAYPIGFHLGSVLVGWKIPALFPRINIMIGLSFTGFGWAVGFLIRRQGHALPAFLAGLLAIMITRNPQSYVGWGGAPTVLAVALTIVAMRLLYDAHDNPSIRPTILGAVCLAGATMCHPTAAWLAAPLLSAGFIVLLIKKKGSRQLWSRLGLAALTGLICILPYLLFQTSEFSTGEKQWVMDNMRHPPQCPQPGVSGVFKYLPYTVGDPALILSTLALAVAVWKRRWSVMLGLPALALVWMTSYVGVWKQCPLAPFIFPERVAMAATACLAWILALGLDTIGVGAPGWARPNREGYSRLALVAVLVMLGVVHADQWYMRGLKGSRLLTREEMQCMEWLRNNTDPEALVAIRPGDAGRWVPAMADRWITCWHLNNVWHDERDQAIAGRRPDVVYIGHEVGRVGIFGVPSNGPLLFSAGTGRDRCEIRAVPESPRGP